MNTITGSTKSEKKMIGAIQAAIGANVDYAIGVQTMTDLAIKIGADCFPLCVNIYSNPVIIAKDLCPVAASAPLKSFNRAISGSFSYLRKPCSILVSGGSVIADAACHYWINGTPESVLYRTADGKIGIRRCKTASDLPGDVKWAIGGVGLLGNYAPTAEGFSGVYSDVLRKTNHTYVGVKHGMVYLGYCSAMTGAQVNAYAKKMGFEMAIMLDGGHVAAINSDETRINTGTTQYYVVKAV